MANKKTDVSILVRGLGMGMAFLQALTEEIVAAGGFEEMVHFLTKEHARPTCKKIAEMIVKSPWQIPRSVMERLTRVVAYDKDRYGDESTFERDKRYNWVYMLTHFQYDFGVPILFFGHDNSGREAAALTKELLDQIVGKPATYPMIISWKGESHVVVGIADGFEEGEIVQGTDWLAIAPAKYFNLEQ